MPEVVRTINLVETFANLKKGESVAISMNDATENNVRTVASRFSKENNVELKVSALRGTGATTVTRNA